MHVALKTLDELRSAQRQQGRSAFTRAFPGAFLLAMGKLSAEVIRSQKSKGSGGSKGDATTAVSFGQRLRHDAEASHPLAGCAFFISPAGGGSEILVGRSPECDLTVPEASVSDRHCLIAVTDGGVMAIDLGSTNGTTINLERVPPEKPTVLADQDILTLGRYSFQLMTAASMWDEVSVLNAVGD